MPSGTTSGMPSSGTTTPMPDAGTCSVYGQECSPTQPCCAPLPCTYGDAGVGHCGVPTIIR
jgi:hypothetical protein